MWEDRSTKTNYFKRILKIYEKILADEPKIIEAKYQEIQELYPQIKFSLGSENMIFQRPAQFQTAKKKHTGYLIYFHLYPVCYILHLWSELSPIKILFVFTIFCFQKLFYHR